MTNPLYWSIRREIWENRSVYIAPLIVTAIVVFALLFSVAGVVKKVENLPVDAQARHTLLVRPFSLAPAPIMFSTFLVGLFYSLDALYGERRDRSLLFWKSMPVSNTLTVLSKIAIPMAVLPLIAFALSLFAFLLLLFLQTFALLGSGMSPTPLWNEVRLAQEPTVMIYGLIVHALWFAPIYAYCMLLSAWVKRSPTLWAALPAVLLVILEKMIANTDHFAQYLRYRVIGAMGHAFSVEREAAGIIDKWSQLTPLRFLGTPGLWGGLLFAALCLALAVRLRRNREPL